MEKYTIITDVTSDLPNEFYRENSVSVLYLSYTMGDVEYANGATIPPHEFYQRMINGELPQTSQITPEQVTELFERKIKEGFDIVYIGFSSGLSGSFNSVRVAAEELLIKYPKSKIRIIDSLAASLGEGLLVYYAVQMKKSGFSFDEVADKCENNRLHVCHMFTVNDLMHLHRGGRVSKASAVAGTILGIKPILHVDNEGHLVPISKVRGRKQSIIQLVEEMGKRIGDWENPVFAISHGDCEDEAIFLQNLVKKKFGIETCIMNYVGTVIGAHSGPKTMALFFLGNER